MSDKIIGSQRSLGMEAEIIAMYYNPDSDAKWLITEANEFSSGDGILYGYNYIFSWGWGYLKRSQLPENVASNDEWIGKTVSEYFDN